VLLRHERAPAEALDHVLCLREELIRRAVCGRELHGTSIETSPTGPARSPASRSSVEQPIAIRNARRLDLDLSPKPRNRSYWALSRQTRILRDRLAVATEREYGLFINGGELVEPAVRRRS